MRYRRPEILCALTSKLICLAVFLIAAIGRCGATAIAADVAAPASPSVVVLRDGGVLLGEVSRVGDRYLLRRGGSEFQLSADSVQAVCGSLEEAYASRRAEINRPTGDAHLALATWCLRYGLLEQTSRELVSARAVEPTHPRIALLERRLEAARAEAARGKSTTASAAKRVAAHSGPPDALAMTSTAALPPGISHEVVERFTRKVQPILVNGCTVSGCHQPGGQQKFQLDRALLRGLANRRTTMRNLSATLTLIDRERPQLSPLLTVSRQTHGGMRSPVFGARQASAFAHVVDWVQLVARSGPARPDPTPTNEVMLASAEAEFDSGPGGTPTTAAVDGEVVTANYEEIEATARPKTSIQYGASLAPWRARDEFDPEIFNRGRQTTQSAAPSPSASPVQTRSAN